MLILKSLFCSLLLILTVHSSSMHHIFFITYWTASGSSDCIILFVLCRHCGPPLLSPSCLLKPYFCIIILSPPSLFFFSFSRCLCTHPSLRSLFATALNSRLRLYFELQIFIIFMQKKNKVHSCVVSKTFLSSLCLKSLLLTALKKLTKEKKTISRTYCL